MGAQAKTYIAICLSAVAMAGVFAYNLPWLVLPIALSIFFWNTTLTVKPHTLKHLLWQTGLFFAIYHTVVLSWFLDVDINMLAGLDETYSIFVQSISLLIMVAVLTLASLPLGIVIYKLQSRMRQANILALIILASSWTVVEWLRSIIFSIFLNAPEASIGDYWNFGSLGLGVVSSPFGFLSRLVGLYGLSFLVVCLSLIIF